MILAMNSIKIRSEILIKVSSSKGQYPIMSHKSIKNWDPTCDITCRRTMGHTHQISSWSPPGTNVSSFLGTKMTLSVRTIRNPATNCNMSVVHTGHFACSRTRTRWNRWLVIVRIPGPANAPTDMTFTVNPVVFNTERTKRPFKFSV